MPDAEGLRLPRAKAATGRGRRLVVVAAGVSSLGDGMWIAAVPLAAAAIHRSATAVAVVSSMALLPWLLVAPVAGAVVDRSPRRRVLVLSDLLRAAVISALVAGFVTDRITIAVLAVAAFLVVAGSIFHGAAQQSLVADLTDGDSTGRNIMNARVSSLEVGGASLVGPPAGSAAYALAPWVPFLADAASFAVSAACLSAVPVEHAEDRDRRHDPVLKAIRDGAAFLLRHRELRTLALLTGAANLTTNSAMVVLVLYATDVGGLGLTNATFGLLLAALALGGVVTGPAAPRLLRRFGPRRLVVAALSLRILVWPALAATTQPIIAAVALAVAGAASMCVTVTVTSLRQDLSPRDMLGRVVTAFRTVGNGAAPLGALLGGVVANVAGLRGAFVAAGAALALAVIAAIPVLARSRALR